MEIFINPDQILTDNQKVQVQVKDPINKISRSFTIRGTDVYNVYNRIVFLFERLAESDEDVKIIHYKRRNIKCQTKWDN